MRRKLTAILLATMLVLTAFAPAAVSAQETETIDSTLSVDVTQDPATGNATVTVTNDSGGVDNATVEVSSDVAYAGNGTYTTDADGTIGTELPNPTEELEIVVNVTADGDMTNATFTLVPVEDSLDATVAQNADGTAYVEVTQYGSAVEGATVNVSSDVAYAGNGTYTTDAEGTVDLPEPETTVNVTVNVTSADIETTTEAQLTPIDFYVDAAQNDDGSATVTVAEDEGPVENATVEVTSDVAYEGNGTYNTSAEGTVDLPAPEQNLTITVTATNGTDQATNTAELTVAGELENGGFDNFGLWITSYIDQLRSEGYFGAEFGQAVSDFATENNPGADNKPEHAGKPDNAGKPDDAGNAAASDEDERGPPEHAQNKQGDTEESADDCEDDESDESCEVESEEETEDDEKERGNSGKSGDKDNSGNNGKARGK